MADQNQLSNLIDKMVQEKTFSLDALTAIQKLRESALEMERTIALLREDREAQRIVGEELNRKLHEANLQLANIAIREKSVEEREAKIFALEKSEAVANAKSSTLDSMFDRIFRNTIVRETINRDVPLTRSYGNNAGDTVERHQVRTTVDTQKE